MQHFKRILESKDYQIISYILKYKLSEFTNKSTSGLKNRLKKMNEQLGEISINQYSEHNKKKKYDPKMIEKEIEKNS